MSSPLRIVAEFFGDVLIGITLILFACILSSAAHHALTPHINFFYLVWFIISLIPFLMYLNWRQGMPGDWWDLLVYGCTVSIQGSFIQAFPKLPNVMNAVIFASLFTVVASYWERFRETRFPRRKPNIGGSRRP